MAEKIYKSLTGIQYTFPVRVKNDGKEERVWISFRGNSDSYITSRKEVQEAIENSDRFKNKEIEMESGASDDYDESNLPSEGNPPQSFPEVKDINMAVEILGAEPYKVDRRSLKTPAGIRAKAKEYNVEFPNLKLD